MRFASFYLHISLLGPNERRLSLHPPHLMDSKGQSTPGALIPFCAYNQVMSAVSKNMSGLTFPVCDQFKPVVKNGQVCYALDMKDVALAKRGKTKPGRGFGVWLAINMPMFSSDVVEFPAKYTSSKDTLSRNMVTLHLSLLQEYTGFWPGMYTMTSLKKLTGTDAFLGLPDNVKNCQVGDQESCKNKQFMEEVQKQCGCIPWSLGINEAQTIGAYNYCSPAAFACIDNIKDRTSDCRVSCTGLHAVVSYVFDTDEVSYWKKFGDMSYEYKRYLNNYAENLEFDSSSESLSINDNADPYSI